MQSIEWMLIAGGALAAGFVTGLTGFGTALVASAFWLHFLDPVVVAPLAAICSVSSHLTSTARLWRSFEWRRTRPMLLGGALGLPLGVLAVGLLAAGTIRLAIALFMIAYAGYALTARPRPIFARAGSPADGGVGLIGGVLGGMAGLSGVLPIVWSQLRGWPAAVQRGVYQPYNLAILSGAALLHALSGNVTRNVLLLYAVCLPGAVFGAWIGALCYERLDPALFRRIVLVLLLVSGVLLVLRSL